MRFTRYGGAAGATPTPEETEQWHRRMSPPENEIPASVGIAVLLGRTDDAAVAVTQVEAFSTGFQFTLAVRLREAPAELAYGGLHELVSSHMRPGVEIPLENRLLLGIEYADGRRASTLHHTRIPDPGDQLVFVQQSGSGGDQSVDQTHWVAPLPPDGEVAFVMAWPGFGMPESRTVVDGAAIRAAATRSQILWPPQPFTREHREPPAPPRPSSGWFAEPDG